MYNTKFSQYQDNYEKTHKGVHVWCSITLDWFLNIITWKTMKESLHHVTLGGDGMSWLLVMQYIITEKNSPALAKQHSERQRLVHDKKMNTWMEQM